MYTGSSPLAARMLAYVLLNECGVTRSEIDDECDRALRREVQAVERGLRRRLRGRARQADRHAAPPDHDHALKEIDRAAMATAETPEQVVEMLRYVLEGQLAR